MNRVFNRILNQGIYSSAFQNQVPRNSVKKLYIFFSEYDLFSIKKMKNLQFLIHIFIFIVISLSKDLQFELGSSKVQSNREWTRVRIAVTGGEFPYEYIYTLLPKGWKQVKNYLYIPKIQLKQNKKFPCRLIVEDDKHQEVRGTILFISKNEKLFIEDQTFNYRYEFSSNFFNEGGYNGKPELIHFNTEKISSNTEKRVDDSVSKTKGQITKQVSSALVQKRSVQQSEKLVNTAGSGLQKIVKEIVPQKQLVENVGKQIKHVQELVKIQTQEKSQRKSIESIFSRLLTPSELDEIILMADAFAISKTIQQVTADDILTCDQKIAYLSDFSGRIKSALQIKTFTLTQLKVIVQGAKLEIQRLDKEIKYTTSEVELLQIKNLRQTLKKELNKLQTAYNNFNEIDSQIEPKELTIVGLNKKIQNLRGKANSNRQYIVDKKLELTKIDSQIVSLQQKLTSLRNRKTQILGEIERLSGQIEKFQKNIKQEASSIKQIQLQINVLNEKSDSLKKIYTNLEIVVERIRDDLSRADEKEQLLNKRIQELENRLTQERDKIVDQQIEILQAIIDSLERNIPNIEQKIDKIYYECYQAKDIEVQGTLGSVVYVMSGKNFENYLQNAYGVEVPSKSVVSYVSLKTVSILDKKWSESFGSVFTTAQLAKTSDFSFADDFNCLNPSKLEKGSGTITKITKNIITVTLQNKTKEFLKLGTCSRIESTTELPAIGQSIYWMGNKNSSIFEVYRASCVNK